MWNTLLPTPCMEEHNSSYIYKIYNLSCKGEDVHVKENHVNVSEICPCFIIFQFLGEIGTVGCFKIPDTLQTITYSKGKKNFFIEVFFCNSMQNVTFSCTLWQEEEHSGNTCLAVFPSSESCSLTDQWKINPAYQLLRCSDLRWMQ